MKKLISLCFLLLVLLGIFYLNTTKETKVRDLGEFKKENLAPDFSKKQKVGNITVVEIEGTPYEIGYQNGVLMKEEVNGLLAEVYSRYLPPRSFKTFLVRLFLLNLVKKIDKHIPSEYRQEMQGVADGAKVGYNDILLMNTFDDGFNAINPVFLLYLYNLTGLSKDAFWGCSSVIVHKGERSPHLIIGQTVDFDVPLGAGRSVLYIVKKTGKQILYIPSFPGIIFLNGLNDKGLILTQRAAPTGQGKIGMPINVLSRKILEESESLDEARKYLTEFQWSIPRSFLIADSKANLSSIFEVLPGKGIKEIETKEGYVGAANHFKDKEFRKVQEDALSKYKNIEYFKVYLDLYQYSLKREEYLQNYIKKEKAASPEKIAKAISDYKPGPAGDMGGTVSNKKTLQAIVFVPEEKTIYMANGLSAPVTQEGFVRIKLK